MDISEKTMDELDAERELEARQKTEAALFLSGRFLRVDELVVLTEVNPLMVKKVLSDLEGEYAEGRGMVLVEQNGQWKMDVHPGHVDMVNKLATGSSEFSLAEQETLALLAHKKEMKQSILVKIRGNKAYEHVKRFVEMGLVHKKRVGHTAELTLQDKFHDYFRLGSSEDIQSDEANKSVMSKADLAQQDQLSSTSLSSGDQSSAEQSSSTSSSSSEGS